MINIGPGRGSEPAGLVELLLDCHTRIRRFVDLADRLALAVDVSEGEIREAAHAVHRYFVLALPLHIEDEERTVLPRLIGLDPDVDAALDGMRREHQAHEAHVSTLVEIAAALDAAPTRHRDLRAALGRATALVRDEFSGHLAAEESIIFPAVARLLANQEEDMLAELRTRRSSAFARSSSYSS